MERERISDAPGAEPEPDIAACSIPLETGRLPNAYGVTCLVLLPVHPRLAHVFWDLSGPDLKTALQRLNDSSSTTRPILRLYDVTDVPAHEKRTEEAFDIDIDPETGRWYVPLDEPERSCFVELGLKSAEGEFCPLVRSRAVSMPREAVGQNRQAEKRNLGPAPGARPPSPHAPGSDLTEQCERLFSAGTASSGETPRLRETREETTDGTPHREP